MFRTRSILLIPAALAGIVLLASCATPGEGPVDVGTEIPSGSDATAAPKPVEIDPHQFDVYPDATPEQIGQVYSDMNEAMYMTLVNEVDFESAANAVGITWGDFARNLASERIAAIFDAQWTPGWRQDNVLNNCVGFIVDGAVQRFLNYDGGDTLSDELTLISATVVSQSEGVMVLEFGQDGNYQGSPSDPNNGTYTYVERITYQLIDGRYRIVGWAPISGYQWTIEPFALRNWQMSVPKE